jgi:hypothetical protein
MADLRRVAGYELNQEMPLRTANVTTKWWKWAQDTGRETWQPNLKNMCRGSVKPAEALRTYRDAVLKAVAARKACNARVFGSSCGEKNHEGNDLDILVDPPTRGLTV